MQKYARGLLDPYNGGRPIDPARTHGQALARMIANQDEVKWRLLRETEGGRPWRSLEETRQCVLCEETFQGWQVRLTWDRCGVPRLSCPTRGCHGTMAQWIHEDAPLFSEKAWHDWRLLLGALCKQTAQGKRSIAVGAGRARSRLPIAFQRQG